MQRRDLLLSASWPAATVAALAVHEEFDELVLCLDGLVLRTRHFLDKHDNDVLRHALILLQGGVCQLLGFLLRTHGVFGLSFRRGLGCIAPSLQYKPISPQGIPPRPNIDAPITQGTTITSVGRIATRFRKDGRIDDSTRSDSSSLTARLFLPSPLATVDQDHAASFSAADWMTLHMGCARKQFPRSNTTTSGSS